MAILFNLVNRMENGYRTWTFGGRGTSLDTSGSESREDGRGNHDGQKYIKRRHVTRLCGRETVALTGQQQQKLQVCKNNWFWRITVAKRVDRRRLNDLREEIGMQFSWEGK